MGSDYVDPLPRRPQSVSVKGNLGYLLLCMGILGTCMGAGVMEGVKKGVKKDDRVRYIE